MVETFALLLFLLSVECQGSGQPIECQSVIKKGGSFKGLGMYYRYQMYNKEHENSYRMFSKGGFEWDFIFNSNNTVVPNRVEDLKKTFNIDSDVIDKFSVLGDYEKDERNCELKTTGISTSYVNCYDNKGNKKSWNKVTNFKDRVIFRHEGKWEDTRVYVVNKFNRSDRFLYNPIKSIASPCGSDCELPLFATQMDSTLFSQMDGVLDIDETKLQLILFNIDGRPMYCSSQYMGSLSEECKSFKNLRSLFDECFEAQVTGSADVSLQSTNGEEEIGSNTDTSIPTTQSANDSVSQGLTVWIWFVIVSVAIDFL